MIDNRAMENARGAAVIVSLVLAFGAIAPSLARAADPCHSEDPLDFNEANRRVDCGDADKPGWGTYDFDREMGRIPDGTGPAAAGARTANYSHLPTSFSAWFDNLSASERRQFAAGVARAADVGGANMSARELDAVMVLLQSEIDSYFDSAGLNADQRRRAIAEIAQEVGVGIEPKRASSGDEYEDFGGGFGDLNDDDFSGVDGELESGFDGWEPLDPTEDFGRPSDGGLNSDLDFEGM